VALGRLVLCKRERVIALEPYGKGLLGTTLRYPYEVRDANATALKERERDDRDDEIARLKGDTQCPPLLHTLLLGSLTQLPFGLKERGHGTESFCETDPEGCDFAFAAPRSRRPTAWLGM
jgi:hypothetical protein